MDAEIKEAVEAALRQELGYGVLLMALLSLVCAAAGAYFGSFLKQRALNAANRRDFERLLADTKRQTQEIEAVRAQIQLDWQKSLELSRHEIGEQRAILALNRDRVGASVAAIVTALGELDLMMRIQQLRVFGSTNWLEATSNVYRACTAVDMNLHLLVLLGVTPEGSTAGVETFRVRDAFDDVMAHLTAKDQSFRDEFPGSSEFDRGKFLDARSELERANRDLKLAVFKCIGLVISNSNHVGLER
jgi:hypothetical protein